MVRQELGIPGAYLLTGTQDKQSELFESFYCSRDMVSCGIKTVFSFHYEMEFPYKNTLRGFRIQKAPWTQNLLFRCTKGSCKVVLLDVRDQKESYKTHESVKISSEGREFLFCSSGIAYAILALEDNTQLYCFADNVVSSIMQIEINAFDETTKSEFPQEGIIASIKDRKAPFLSELTQNCW